MRCRLSLSKSGDAALSKLRLRCPRGQRSSPPFLNGAVGPRFDGRDGGYSAQTPTPTPLPGSPAWRGLPTYAGIASGEGTVAH